MRVQRAKCSVVGHRSHTLATSLLFIYLFTFLCYETSGVIQAFTSTWYILSPRNFVWITKIRLTLKKYYWKLIYSKIHELYLFKFINFSSSINGHHIRRSSCRYTQSAKLFLIHCFSAVTIRHHHSIITLSSLYHHSPLFYIARWHRLDTLVFDDINDEGEASYETEADE